MSKLINSIVSKNFVEADSILSETVELIMARKLEEAKKMVAAKIEEQPHMMNRPAARLRLMDIAEEDVEEAVDPKEGSDVAEKGTPQPPKNTTVVPKNNMGRPGSTHYKNMKEQVVNRDGKTSSLPYKKAQTKFTNDVIRGRATSKVASDLAKDDMTPQERMRSNRTQDINTKLRTPAPRAGGYTDARTNKPYVSPKAEKMPLTGPTTPGSPQSNVAGKTDRVIRPSPIKTTGTTTTVQKVNEEQLDEARVKIVKARIRGGKIQRRKRVSNVPGYRVQGTKLQRMSPAERRRRKMGARKAKIKRKAKMSRTLMKRQRSIRRRKALGL